MTHPFQHESTSLPVEEALAFAPLHKRHFGTAIGAAAALVVALLTVLDLLLTPPDDAGLIGLLENLLTGYTVSWPGVFIGAAWAFFVGWVAGWFLAFCRNFALAATVFWVRAKANLRASSEFLDHI
jgi:hypothetical protein